MTLRPCLECGEPAEGSRCDGCAPVAERPRRYPKTSPRARGYDRQWDMLSAQLRRIAVCGTRSGLQGHHLPGAWARVACGLPLATRRQRRRTLRSLQPRRRSVTHREQPGGGVPLTWGSGPPGPGTVRVTQRVT